MNIGTGFPVSPSTEVVGFRSGRRRCHNVVSIKGVFDSRESGGAEGVFLRASVNCKKRVGEALPFGRADLGAQAPSVCFLCFFRVSGKAL